jgi:hypothetical protein
VMRLASAKTAVPTSPFSSTPRHELCVRMT